MNYDVNCDGNIDVADLTALLDALSKSEPIYDKGDKIFTGAEFAAKAIDIAKNYKTLYIKGCFGAPMTDKNKVRYTSNCDYNKRADRKEMIMKASSDTFGFDCICLVKGILWGWSGKLDSLYGGAAYKSNGVPDTDPAGMLKLCSDVSTDFSHLEVGEYLWMSGHAGIYVGNGLSVECTPKWSNDVQITACNQTIKGYNRRDWSKHGKLPWIAYSSQPVAVVKLPILKKGMKVPAVKSAQELLLGKHYDLKQYGADGSFGTVTENAVKAFQKDAKLQETGIIDSDTWTHLITD